MRLSSALPQDTILGKTTQSPSRKVDVTETRMTAEEIAEWLSSISGQMVSAAEVKKVMADGSMPEQVTVAEYLAYLSGQIVS